MKVIVAMSGGVDSSVAAYLLKKQGVDVVGLSFELWDSRGLEGSNLCCSIETINLARSISKSLGIEHHTVDVRDSFYSYVIEDFCGSYMKGVTPNPCILCNKYVKFDFLMKKAAELGADAVATGHYARKKKSSELPEFGPDLKNDEGLKFRETVLLKGVDGRKDQSYVLYVMKQEELSKTIFPLGEMTKEETRAVASEIGLANALREESQEICFVGDDKYVDFIEDFSPESVQPGDIKDREGNILGRHKGIAFYTIGQRKRLGISSLKPHYVTAIDRISNTVIAGPREDAMHKTLRVNEINWLSIEPLGSPIRSTIKIRSTMKEVPALITPGPEGEIDVEFDEPQWAPAPGQSAVFYCRDIVLGGGLIC